MSDRIRADFAARRARILKKHAARDPEWQKHRRERRGSGLSVAVSVVVALAVIGVGFKGLTLARLGPEGYQQAISATPAGQTLPAWVLAPGPVSDAVARFFAGAGAAGNGSGDTTVATLTD